MIIYVYYTFNIHIPYYRRRLGHIKPYRAALRTSNRLSNRTERACRMVLSDPVYDIHRDRFPIYNDYSYPLRVYKSHKKYTTIREYHAFCTMS